MKNTSFIRKIVYLGIIAALIFPLSLISRPSSLGKERNDEGGKLAQLRTQHSLSQANLMDIDPASETMKLATLGLRGVAVNALWMQAIEHKKKENWDGLASTLAALIKVQPNFIKVWEYQAHNLSYNISMEFDDYEYRYHWVKKGIDFLEDGIPYNRKDHRMLDHLGFFTGMKLGRSDERYEFRRMFREDTDFHNLMSEHIDPESYNEGEYGYDNWKMAWNWYDMSQALCKQAGVTQNTSDVLYFAKRPAQLRNEAQSLKDEFITGTTIQEIWEEARNEWIDYGRMQIQNSLDIKVTLEGTLDYSERLEMKRQELDALAPGVRQDLVKTILDELGISEEDQMILDIPIAERNDEQAAMASQINARVLRKDNIIDVRVLAEVPENKKLAGRRITDEILEVLQQMRAIESQDGISNYRYWRERTECEASEITVAARRASFDAKETAKRSVFDDEYIMDRKTGEKIITQQGAISKFEEAFAIWSQVFEQNERMRGGELGDSVIAEINQYAQMLQISNIDWKDDFPLQAFIDVRDEKGEGDGLMTSAMLAEREAIRQEALEEQMENEGLNDPDDEPEMEEPEMEDPADDGTPDEENPDAENSEEENADKEAENGGSSDDDGDDR